MTSRNQFVFSESAQWMDRFLYAAILVLLGWLIGSSFGIGITGPVVAFVVAAVLANRLDRFSFGERSTVVTAIACIATAALAMGWGGSDRSYVIAIAGMFALFVWLCSPAVGAMRHSSKSDDGLPPEQTWGD